MRTSLRRVHAKARGKRLDNRSKRSGVDPAPPGWAARADRRLRARHTRNGRHRAVHSQPRSRALGHALRHIDPQAQRNSSSGLVNRRARSDLTRITSRISEHAPATAGLTRVCTRSAVASVLGNIKFDPGRLLPERYIGHHCPTARESWALHQGAHDVHDAKDPSRGHARRRGELRVPRAPARSSRSEWRSFSCHSPTTHRAASPPPRRARG